MAIKDRRAIYAGPEGNQLQAAGILFISDDSKKVLTIFRAARIVDPSVWCSGGGKIEKGETPQEAARREIAEELGYTGDMELYPAYVYETEELKFHNFIGLVPVQFFPKLNWESDGYVWTDLKDIPEPKHYGLKALLEDKDTQSIINMLIDGFSD